MKQQLTFLSVVCLLVANPSTVFAEDTPPSNEVEKTVDTTSSHETPMTPSLTASTAGLTPHQVYLKFRDVLNTARSLEQLEPFLARASIENLKRSASVPGVDVISELKKTEPTQVKLISEKINADKATLEMSASDASQGGTELANKFQKEFATAFGAKPKMPVWVSEGTLGFIKQNGVWKIGERNWTIRPSTPAISQQQGTLRTSKPAPPKASQQNWVLGAATVDFPKTPASGKVHGVPFRVETALLENGALILKQGKGGFADLEFMVGLENRGKTTGSLENASFVTPSSAGSCYMSWLPSPGGVPTTKSYFPSEIGMRLQFGRKQANGLLPGYIVLRVPDPERSYVQGYFYARSK